MDTMRMLHDVFEMKEERMRELSASLSDAKKAQLQRALAFVLNSFNEKNEWDCLIITANMNVGALLVTTSPGVSDMDAIELVDAAKDAMMQVAYDEAPDRKDMN